MSPFDFGEFPTLETERLVLREMTPADAADVASAYVRHEEALLDFVRAELRGVTSNVEWKKMGKQK